MTPLLSRVYFNAVYGALGGLLGWLLFGVYGEKNPSRDPAFLPAQVHVKDLADGKEKTFVLVGPGAENAATDHVLTTSSIGQALLGKKVGEKAEIKGTD